VSSPGSPAPIDSPVLLDTDVFSALFFGGADAARYDTAVAGREILLSSFSQGEVLRWCGDA
jgi:predicted nucleic acid-binding protein